MNSRVVRILTPGSKYVGRPHPLGNPFVIGKDGTREEVIAKYKEWFYEKVKEEDFADKVRRFCGNRTLACFCAPLPCHAEVIVEWLETQGL